jgi:hypothetical protein
VRVEADALVGCVGEPDALEQHPRPLHGGLAAKAVQTPEEDQVLEPGDPEVEASVAGRDEADQLPQPLGGPRGVRREDRD